MEAKQTNKSFMTIRTVLGLAGLDITKRIKLVRHKDSRDAITINGKTVVGNPYDWYLNDRKKVHRIPKRAAQGHIQGR